MKKLLLALGMMCAPAAQATTRIEVVMQVGADQMREEFVLQVGETIQLGEGPLVVQGTVTAEEADKVIGDLVICVCDADGQLQPVGKDTLELAWNTAVAFEFPVNEDTQATLTLIAHQE